ncbi:MAG TPA: ABC transporter substrate-binding protein [Clostridia bacterium]|nr:ABC transporter substrate-binding protein [Clostridia bacterium]
MKKLIILVSIFLLLLTSCSTETDVSNNEMMELNIGVMPAVDTAPIFLAKERGYFQELNLDLNVEIYTNAQNRQSALQTNSIDGAMTDLIAVATNVNNGFNIQATMLTDGMFVLLSQKDQANEKELSIGMMEISVSNFLVDHWLDDTYIIDKVYINAIPARLEAVLTNQLDMGLFPEPIASVGELKGLTKLSYEPIDGFSPDVMVFTDEAITEKSKAIEAFHAGYNKAIEDINSDASLARQTIIDNIPNVSADLKDVITLPTYHSARLPDDEYLKKIIEWTNSVLDEPLTINSKDLVDRSFVE